MDLYRELKGLRILLVDNDDWTRNSLSLFFELEEYQFSAFKTAEEGMEALKKQEYDVIITAHRLPGMDGLKFLEGIQASCPSALKILTTTYGTEEILPEVRKLGVQEFIQKPLTIKAIEESLSSLIEDHEQEDHRPHVKHSEQQVGGAAR